MLARVADLFRVVPADYRKPFWLIPNLLSLDAPLVAMSWLYVFAKTWRVNYLPWAAYVSLGLVVWIIYASDRLLDSTMHDGSSNALAARHNFHRKHQRKFLFLIVLAALTALVMVITQLSSTIYSYAMIGGVMVIGFFILSAFTTKEPDELPYAKNILAGASFAYGTAMIAYDYTSFEMKEFIYSKELICFALLCILNISAIDLWEHADATSDVEVKAVDELALTFPLTLLGAASIFFAARDESFATRPFFYAVLTGAALLQILNRARNRFSMNSLRVLADVAMLVPVLVFIVSSKQQS
jgi:hypothetical protein